MVSAARPAFPFASGRRSGAGRWRGTRSFARFRSFAPSSARFWCPAGGFESRAMPSGGIRSLRPSPRAGGVSSSGVGGLVRVVWPGSGAPDPGSPCTGVGLPAGALDLSGGGSSCNKRRSFRQWTSGALSMAMVSGCFLPWFWFCGSLVSCSGGSSHRRCGRGARPGGIRGIPPADVPQRLRCRSLRWVQVRTSKTGFCDGASPGHGGIFGVLRDGGNSQRRGWLRRDLQGLDCNLIFFLGLLSVKVPGSGSFWRRRLRACVLLYCSSF